MSFSVKFFLQQIRCFQHFDNKFSCFLFVGFIEEATFTLSNRGQFKLIHQGFGYNKMSISAISGITTWRCSLNQSYPHLHCKAKAYTCQVGSTQRVKLSDDMHTHTTTILTNGKKRKKPNSKAKKKPKKVNKPARIDGQT